MHSLFHSYRQCKNEYRFSVKANKASRLKRDGTRAETRFGLSAKRTSPFKLVPGGEGVSSVDYWQPRCAHQRY